ncbi:MAG: response regulator [Candidatus Zambryskibacteria bacterium]|nr:response regulator [Candidatus Zambryskibacteria bacterium]
MKKVLIVEDDSDWQSIWKRKLEGKIQTITASSVEEGERLFNENPDVDAIVMDACLSGEEPDTPPLVTKIRQTFNGPMIAASGSSTFRQCLKSYGCDYESKKHNVSDKVLEILGVS